MKNFTKNQKAKIKFAILSVLSAIYLYLLISGRHNKNYTNEEFQLLILSGLLFLVGIKSTLSYYWGLPIRTATDNIACSKKNETLRKSFLPLCYGGSIGGLLGLVFVFFSIPSRLPLYICLISIIPHGILYFKAKKKQTTKSVTEPDYISEARERAKRRKSPWNLLLIPFVIFFFGLSWYALTSFFLFVQRSLMPDDIILSSFTNVSAMLIMVLPIFPSIAFGMIFANMLIWLITPARKALSNEASKYPGTDFKNATRSLLVALRYMCTFTIPFCLLGIFNYLADSTPKCN